MTVLNYQGIPSVFTAKNPDDSPGLDKCYCGKSIISDIEINTTNGTYRQKSCSYGHVMHFPVAGRSTPEPATMDLPICPYCEKGAIKERTKIDAARINELFECENGHTWHRNETPRISTVSVPDPGPQGINHLDGGVCPDCNSDDSEVEEHFIQDRSVDVHYICNKCHAIWHDVHEFKRRVLLKKGGQ